MQNPKSLRRRALDKLAALSVQSPSSAPSASSDLTRLCDVSPSPQAAVNGSGKSTNIGRIPMTLRELEVLLALCEAAPSVSHLPSATRLLQQISPYVSECCYQAIVPSTSLYSLQPCPWELLTSKLVTAVLSLGANHPSLRAQVNDSISGYTEHCRRFASYFNSHRQGKDNINGDGESSAGHTMGARELLGISTLTTSIVGFLDAAARNLSFWTLEERHQLIQEYDELLSDEFLVTVETALSTIRHAPVGTEEIRTWRQFQKQYSAVGRPLGAMLLREGFIRLVMVTASSMVVSSKTISELDVIQTIMAQATQTRGSHSEAHLALVDIIATISAREIVKLEDGSDYLQLGSTWQQRLAYIVKASALTSFLCCALMNEEAADADVLMPWLEASLADQAQAKDVHLVTVVLSTMAVLATISPATATALGRSMPRIIVRTPMSPEGSRVAADCLLFILRQLPQDTIITTLYSLGNALSVRHGGADAPPGNYALFNDLSMESQHPRDSTTSTVNLMSSVGTANDPAVYDAVIQAIVTVASGIGDPTLTALALSMLVQKVGKINMSVDLKIISEAAVLASTGGVGEFRSLLRLYMSLSQQGLTKPDQALLDAVSAARDHLSRTLRGGSELYEAYLQHLLEIIVSKGEAPASSGGQKIDLDNAAREIAILLRPLSILVASNVGVEGITDVESFAALQRDAWFNLAVHGFSTRSPLGKRHIHELRVLAKYTRPLIAEERANNLVSDIELNTVLRRGMSTDSTAHARKELGELLPQCEPDIRTMTYPELMFLKATHLVETFRASTGDCTKVQRYFVDRHLRGTALGSCIANIAVVATDIFISTTLSGQKDLFSAPYVAQQLAHIFEDCCHRVESVQKVAFTCADRIVASVPPALCQRTSLFTLLDLLSIMWAGCLEGETDEYKWTSTHVSARGTTSVQLSDDYNFRRFTLRALHRKARDWVGSAINLAPLDVKGLLQTYLSDYADDDTFGHLSLGRSFAFEMGALIPKTDHKLGAIEAEDQLSINTASDFMAQYTTRQEYRFTEALQDASTVTHHLALDSSLSWPLDARDGSILGTLSDLEVRIHNKEHVSISELRTALRRAATLLCRAKGTHHALVALFVRLPFLLFSKSTIKLGLSLWIGVLKENPALESRILIEIIENWIVTVHSKTGMFSERLRHLDPFFIKEEFAPSDEAATSKQQQRANDLLTPHLRVLQFLSSHYTATRLSSSSIEKAYYRMFRITCQALRHTTSHPLAREVHFSLILLGLQVLRYNTSLSGTAQWRFKDDLLSAGLAWFAHSPRWSFGGNRVQIKAETHIIADVALALQQIAHVGSKLATLRPLMAKQDLLQALLASEQARLMVWLFPLDASKRGRSLTDENICSLLPIAWEENAAIAIHFVSRFPSQRVFDSVRWLLLNHSELAISEPDALQILLGSSLPNDVSTQLKYLIFWSPVNPITAVTYFLPAFGNHPSIIQYAVRALESHSVDVTFFYVPQIVQGLRYDVLGYVERFIVETAKFSQLFAHQIIWNMRANSYKDDDSTIPDPMKPVLDKVTESLVHSFSRTDREFYEKEFTFFNEVTDISGKLKPFIKKSKPEKKQKIEEELRKIQVEVGVYLPSNPDGVVIGIDRKSGKPLQSHAKAPYMATFRIRKEYTDDMESTQDQLARVNSTGDTNAGTARTYEIWQSAIFKVGDDCRQDVLALQMIAAFRGIFHYVGLPVYVFPYRVTATAPGCGVIDVLPNSVSRDMLGREAVNGLHEWFLSKFGGEDAPAYQAARVNFVKSLAAYSVISFLLQFKDRHNGNIMLDDAGHILHIDFGFCFDIAPGGVRFERAPFKLTKEMIAVMGGSTETQSFRWFEEMCVKAFLATRQYVETLSHLVVAMLDSGLPCFKPETVRHFKERFVLEKGEREAAEFMRGLVRRSAASYSTGVYDQFQLLTNGIPYEKSGWLV